MTVFIVAQFQITDHGRFRQYQQAMRSVLERFEGQLILSSGNIECLSGDPHTNHVAVTAFPSEAAARTFLNSADYQITSVLRAAGAEMTSLMLRDRSAYVRNSDTVNLGDPFPAASAS